MVYLFFVDGVPLPKIIYYFFLEGGLLHVFFRSLIKLDQVNQPKDVEHLIFKNLYLDPILYFLFDFSILIHIIHLLLNHLIGLSTLTLASY